MAITSQETFGNLDAWGYVDPGTQLVDSTGTCFIVESQDDDGFLLLKNQSPGGAHLPFEAMDKIDHRRFRIA